MWKLAAALVTIALVVLIAYNLGNMLLPASAGAPPPGLGAWTIDISFDDSDMDLTDGVCETASGGCSMRAAFEQANFATKTGCTPCTITFDPAVFPPGGPVVISLDSELPDIVVPLTIDGKGAGVILEPGLGVPAFCGFCVLDDTPANPTDFTINGGGAFTIREFPVGVLIGGDDGGGFGFGPVDGVNLSGLDIDSSGFAGIGIFGDDGVTDINISDTSVSNSGDGIVIDNLDGPTDSITFDNVTVDQSAQRGIALPGQSISNVTFNNIDIDSSGRSGISIGGEGVTNVDLSNSTISNNGFGDFGDFPGFEIIAPDGPVQGITFGSLDIDANAGSGIHIEGESIVDMIFDGVRTFNNGGDGIFTRNAGPVRPPFSVWKFNNVTSDSNTGHGIRIDAGGGDNFSFIGGTISNNGGAGIDIHPWGEFGTCLCDIFSNTLSNNSGPAVNITDYSGITVRNNVMSGNGTGVVVAGGAEGNTISQNSMDGNVGLGIDQDGDGLVTDPREYRFTIGFRFQRCDASCDAQFGGGTNAVDGSACSGCLVELFLTDDPPDPSGHGEGMTFLSDTVADGTGAFAFELGAFPCGLPAGSLTATATDTNGTTSEFSANVPGFPGTEPCPLDKDGDGCTDAQELGMDENLGGQRDPNHFWDFFDPNRDGSVTLLDFLAVLRHFGAVSVPPPTKAEALAEALLPEPPIGDYWALADRGGQAPGGDPWDELPPNGSIGLLDFLSVLRQFGHTCA